MFGEERFAGSHELAASVHHRDETPLGLEVVAPDRQLCCAPDLVDLVRLEVVLDNAANLGRRRRQACIGDAPLHETLRTPYAPRAAPRRCGRPASSPDGRRNDANIRANANDC